MSEQDGLIVNSLRIIYSDLQLIHRDIFVKSGNRLITIGCMVSINCISLWSRSALRMVSPCVWISLALVCQHLTSAFDVLSLEGRVALVMTPISDVTYIRALRVYLKNPNAVYLQLWRHLEDDSGGNKCLLEWQQRVVADIYIGRHVINLDSPLGPITSAHKLAVQNANDPGPVPFDVTKTPQMNLSLAAPSPEDLKTGISIISFDPLMLPYSFMSYMEICEFPNCADNFSTTTSSTSSSTPSTTTTKQTPGPQIQEKEPTRSPSIAEDDGVELLSESFMMGMLIWLIVLTFLLLCVICLLICLVCQKKRTKGLDESVDRSTDTLSPEECYVVMDDPPYSAFDTSHLSSSPYYQGSTPTKRQQYIQREASRQAEQPRDFRREAARYLEEPRDYRREGGQRIEQPRGYVNPAAVYNREPSPSLQIHNIFSEQNI